MAEGEVNAEHKISTIMTECIGILEDESLIEFATSDDRITGTVTAAPLYGNKRILEEHIDKIVGLVRTLSSTEADDSESGVTRERLTSTFSKLARISRYDGVDEDRSDSERDGFSMEALIPRTTLERLVRRHNDTIKRDSLLAH